MSASDDERREELRGRLPNVIRVAAGLAANAHDDMQGWSDVQIADFALEIVIACEAVCGIGADDD